MILSRRFVTFKSVVALMAATGLFACSDRSGSRSADSADSALADSLETLRKLQIEDSLKNAAADSASRFTGLTDADFNLVARELDIEPAAIKAVVMVETGGSLKGFSAPGVPVVNYDKAMWKLFGNKGSRQGDPNASVPEGLTGYELQEWTYLTNARKVNRDGADMSTFWGMFQIGGFNYELCDCRSVGEFVEKMSRSELEQLKLFSTFMKNTGYLDDIRNKDWAAFSRKYNGPGYAARGYHIKMAEAYEEFLNK